jgi:hypothetical protein
MVLYYAMGGGLGHLMRTLAVLHTLNINEFKIITASPLATKIFNKEDLILIPGTFEKNAVKLRIRMTEIIKDVTPDELFIDTFPAGIMGELYPVVFPENMKKVYISRILKTDKYRFMNTCNIMFDESYILEEGMTEKHIRFITEHSVAVKHLDLKYPPYKGTGDDYLDTPSGKPVWMIMHSGSGEEVDMLVRYAKEIASLENVTPFLWVVTQSAFREEVDRLTDDRVPAHGLISCADRLFSACGVNMMYLTRSNAVLHYFIPFPRKYDDQFRRALIRKQEIKTGR